MKKSILVGVFVVVAGIGNFLFAQEESSISQARKDNLIELLNYRFKGGYYTFEKIFQQSVEYPPIASANCIMGIAIVSVKVNCKGIVDDLRIKTPLGYGIDNEISKFFAKTEGQWNNCRDEKYTKFEIPIQFKIKGSVTNTKDALLVFEVDNTPGYLCNDDQYYIDKLNKYISKGKNKKALQYLGVLIQRDPYNTDYYDMRMKILNGE